MFATCAQRNTCIQKRKVMERLGRSRVRPNSICWIEHSTEVSHVFIRAKGLDPGEGKKKKEEEKKRKQEKRQWGLRRSTCRYAHPYLLSETNKLSTTKRKFLVLPACIRMMKSQ